jgi:hypothetical protein
MQVMTLCSRSRNTNGITLGSGPRGTAEQTDPNIEDAIQDLETTGSLDAGIQATGSSKITIQTLPSYSRRESTSGAMYAGVPTVDLGLECSRDDCDKETLPKKGVSN